MVVEKKYRHLEEFEEVYEKVRKIPRSPLTREDYLRGGGKTSLKHKIDFLSKHMIYDLFRPDGELIDVFRGHMFDEKGKHVEWDFERLYEAYKGTEKTPSCNHGRSFIYRGEVTDIVRLSMHKLEEYFKMGCNLLLYHEYRSYPLLFFTTAIPARISRFVVYSNQSEKKGGNVVQLFKGKS